MSEKLILNNEPLVKANSYPVSGSYGLVDSISSLKKNEIRLDSKGVVLSRILNPKNNDLWKWFDVNNEAVRFNTNKSYSIGKEKLSSGDYTVLIVNGQTFSRNPNNMKLFIDNKGKLDDKEKLGLISNSMPLGKDYTNNLLGEKVVWALKDGIIQKTEIPSFTVDSYIKAQKDNPNFLIDNHSFFVVFTEEQAQKYNHNKWLKFSDQKVINHVPSQIQSGTKAAWSDLLKIMKEVKGYENVYVGMPNLPLGVGRAVCVNDNDNGFGFYGISNSGGCSVGVVPEALDTLVKAYNHLKIPINNLSNDFFAMNQDVPTGKFNDKAYIREVFNNANIAKKYNINNK